MSETIIKIKHISAGQPRPYADSVHTSEISAERHGVYTDNRVLPCYLDKEDVKVLTQMFVRDFQENPGPFAPYLKYIGMANKPAEHDKTKCDKWKVSVCEPFTD